MSIGIYRQPLRKGVSGFLITPEAGIRFGQVPKDGVIPRIKLSRLFEVGDRFLPAALAAVDRAGGIPDLGIIGRGLLGDRELGAGQFVVAITKIVVVSERQPRIAEVRLETQRVVCRDLCLRETRPASIIAK